MADVVNLNRARKAKERAQSQADAAENRAKFGRTKAEKTLARALDEKAQRKLDQSKRDT